MQSVQVYLTTSSASDKLVLDVWNLAKTHDRPQELFRRILQAGVATLAERGELPEDITKRIPSLAAKAANLSREMIAAAEMVRSFASGLGQGGMPAAIPMERHAVFHPAPQDVRQQPIMAPAPPQPIAPEIVLERSPEPIEAKSVEPPKPAVEARPAAPAGGDPTAADILSMFGAGA